MNVTTITSPYNYLALRQRMIIIWPGNVITGQGCHYMELRLIKFNPLDRDLEDNIFVRHVKIFILAIFIGILVRS